MDHLSQQGRGTPGSRWRGIVPALAMVLALATTAGCSRAEEEAQARAAVEGMKSDIASFQAKDQADPLAPITPFEIGEAAGDEGARMHQVMRQFMNSVLEVRNGYLGELDAIGWQTILDAERLKADAGLADSRRMVDDARAAMRRAEAGSVAAFDKFPAIVAAADLSARNKRDMLAGFEDSKPRGIQELRASFALEAETLDEIGKMVELLARVPWEVEQSQIMFHQDADVATFNAHFERIGVLTAQLEARQKANLDRAQESLNSASP